MSVGLTRNSEMARDGIWNWTLPAWVVTLDDGRSVNVCPTAGACKDACYARNGTYLFPKVRAAHLRNLTATLDNLDGWRDDLTQALRHRKFRPTGEPRLVEWIDTADEWLAAWLSSGGQAVRIHDSGDFYSDDYLAAWMDIAETVSDVLFYAYTKEVSRMRRLAHQAPVNFRWLYSLGGREDHLIDRDTERHADVFADLDTMERRGYVDQSASDLLAVVLPTTRIGIPSNNISRYRRRLAGRSFGDMEAGMRRHGRAS